MHGHVQGVAGTENVLPQQPCLLRFAHSRGNPTNSLRDLTANVDEGMVGADGVRRDDDALEQCVGVGHHDRDVLAGSRLRLIRIDDEIVGLIVVLWDKAPLQSRREARTAPATQTRVLDRGDDGVRILAQCLGQRSITTGAAISLDVEEIRLIPVGRDHGRQRSHVSHFPQGLRVRSCRAPWRR